MKSRAELRKRSPGTILTWLSTIDTARFILVAFTTIFIGTWNSDRVAADESSLLKELLTEIQLRRQSHEGLEYAYSGNVEIPMESHGLFDPETLTEMEPTLPEKSERFPWEGTSYLDLSSPRRWDEFRAVKFDASRGQFSLLHRRMFFDGSLIQTEKLSEIPEGPREPEHDSKMDRAVYIFNQKASRNLTTDFGLSNLLASAF